MNQQSQWLFEAPPSRPATHKGLPNRRRQALFRVGEAPASLCPPSGQTLPWVVMGWSRYKQKVEELPPPQRDVVRTIGDAIISSFKPNCRPVREVRIQGHADHDTPRNSDREMKMSLDRAQQTASWLRAYVTSAIGAKANGIVWVSPVGFGATKLKAPPTTERNRSQNRRVEIFVTVSSPPPPPPPSPQPPGPSIGPLPPGPPQLRCRGGQIFCATMDFILKKGGKFRILLDRDREQAIDLEHQLLLKHTPMPPTLSLPGMDEDRLKWRQGLRIKAAQTVDDFVSGRI